MNQDNQIRFVNRETGKTEVEKVYGDAFVRWLYESKAGALIGSIASSAPISKFYGALQDLPSSKKKIKPFIENFQINMNEYIPEDGRDVSDPYSTFNNFFTRRLADGARPIEMDSSKMASPADARYVAFNEIEEDQIYPVKGKYLHADDLVASDKWKETFKGGPLMIARLCPVDYHRYHYPDNGKVLDYYRVNGKLHSVNPVALRARGDIFITNERQVTILETENFGKLAYIEVGATCVGKIVQTHDIETPFNRGAEKGMFLFGGSTVIVVGEKGKWLPDQDIVENTSNGVETYIKMGAGLAHQKL